MRADEQVIWCQAAITTVWQAIPVSPFNITGEHAALQKDLLTRLVESRRLAAQNSRQGCYESSGMHHQGMSEFVTSENYPAKKMAHKIRYSLIYITIIGS